jgi:hypothetical protein
MVPVTATEYWAYANKQIAAGWITKKRARQVARVGHRKCGNWARHLRDLESFVKWKQNQEGGSHATEEQEATDDDGDSTRRQAG